MTYEQAIAARDTLEAEGFALSFVWHDADDPSGAQGWRVSVRCSACEALVIQGHATHETGCPNQTRECSECDALVPKRQRLCEDCARDESEWDNACWPEDASNGEQDVPEPEEMDNA